MTVTFRPGSRAAYSLLRAVASGIGVPFFRPRVEGREFVLDPRPFIVACNHVTLLDWAALAFFIPRPIRFLMTRTYYDRPVLRWFFRWGGAIPVTPGRVGPSALHAAHAALERGEVVGIFPEGRLVSDGTEHAAHRGVAALAARAGVPVVPATIRGAREAFPATARLPRPRTVTVVFGPCLWPPAPDSSRAVQEQFTRELMRRIADLSAPAGSS
jgi:1-acyl-sn-glycerol-3-phosphate acyltransferase